MVSILLPCIAPTHQSASYVFTDFQGVGVTTSKLLNWLTGVFACYQLDKNLLFHEHCLV